jgi:hypothetical protein
MRNTGKTSKSILRCISLAQAGQDVLYVCQHSKMSRYCFDLAMSLDPSGEPVKHAMKIRYGVGSVSFRCVSDDPDGIYRGRKLKTRVDHDAWISAHQNADKWSHYLSLTEDT